MAERHAVYATVSRRGERAGTLRVGQPVDWRTAQRRWTRLDSRRAGHANVPRRPVRVRHDGRLYDVDFLEVRAVDTFGRGLGSERHATALVQPYRSVRSALR